MWLHILCSRCHVTVRLSVCLQMCEGSSQAAVYSFGIKSPSAWWFQTLIHVFKLSVQQITVLNIWSWCRCLWCNFLPRIEDLFRLFSVCSPSLCWISCELLSFINLWVSGHVQLKRISTLSETQTSCFWAARSEKVQVFYIWAPTDGGRSNPSLYLSKSTNTTPE